MSPLKLIQEELSHDPWKLLVACIMLNQTSYKQVRPIIWSFFETYPDATTLSHTDANDVAKLIRPLGFQNRRAKTLVRFSREYAAGDWSDPSDLHGVGKYAADSYAMFVEGNVRNTDPTDKKLAAYKQWWHDAKDDVQEA